MIQMTAKMGFMFLILVVTAPNILAQSGNLEVIVTGIKETKGAVKVGLFDNDKDFLKKAVYGKTVKVSGNSATVVFENLPVGDYAVSVIHDENENGDLDSNFMGVPTEGFGFGNNAMGMFGPPSYDKAKISWNGKGNGVEVKLKYF